MSQVHEVLLACKESDIALSIDDAGKLKLAFNGKPPTPALLKKIKTNKSDIIELLRSEDDVAPTVAPNVATYPLSSSQKRMWFMSKVESDMSQYHICMPIKITGCVKKEEICNAINTSIKRHEVLRTTYHESDDGKAYQLVEEFNPIDIEYLKDESHVQEFISKPFNLSYDYPVRIGVQVHSQSDCDVIIVIHHIATDGWSSGILAKEFMSYFKQESLPSLKLQFKDFAYFESNHEKISDSDKKYWAKRLEEVSTLHSFPLDMPRTESSGNAGGREKVVLSDELVSGIKSWASDNKLTPFCLFHSALSLAMLLASDQKDIVIGVPVAGRRYASLKDMVGFFVDVMPIVSSLEQEVTYSDFVNSHSERIKEDLAHDGLTFEKIVELINPTRYPLTAPIFQIMLNYQNSDIDDVKIDGLEISVMPDPNFATEYEMEVIVSEKEGFQVDILYNSSLFEQSRIKLLNSVLIDIIQCIVYKGNEKIRPITGVFKEGLVGDKSFDIEFNFSAHSIDEKKKEAISNIWKDILKVSSSELEDNFFEAGGTSLQAISMFNKMKEQELVVIPNHFFINPVFETLLSFQNNNGPVDNSDDFSDLEEFDI